MAQATKIAVGDYDKLKGAGKSKVEQGISKIAQKFKETLKPGDRDTFNCDKCADKTNFNTGRCE